MELFKEELALLLERGDGAYCAADALEAEFNMDVPVGTKMFGTWTSEEWREETEGMDPWEKPFPTITKGGVWLKFPSGREVFIKVEHLHWIRTFNGDRAFEFSPSD